MLFQPPPRLSSALASALTAAGLMLTVASCAGHITPLGPDGPKPTPTLIQRAVAAPQRVLISQVRLLQSPLVLEAMRVQTLAPAGGCPAGYVTLSGDNSGQCYSKIGTPVTFTSAAVSSVYPGLGASGQAPTRYGFTIVLPAADVPALTAVTTTAYKAHGSLAISVAGRTWALPLVAGPFTSPQFQVQLPRNQAIQLQRLLVPSG
jgi:hypothetical protein